MEKRERCIYRSPDIRCIRFGISPGNVLGVCAGSKRERIRETHDDL